MTSEGGDSSAERPEAEELSQEVRTRVAARRAAGLYPPDLEARLARHFDQVRQHREGYDALEPVRRAVAEVHEASRLHLDEPEPSGPASRMPNRARYHLMVGRVVRFHVHPLVAQLQRYVDAVDVLLDRFLERLDDPGRHTHGDLVRQVDAVADRVMRIEVDPEGAVAELAALRERVAALEASVHVRPWWASARYVDRFGAPSLPLELSGCEPVVAVDADSGLAALSDAPDSSVGAITVVGGIETLPRQAVADLPVLAWTKLRPGGHLLVAGIDPATRDAAVRAGVDLRWRGVVHPDLMAFLCEAAGFTEIEVTVPAPDRYLVRATRAGP